MGCGGSKPDSPNPIDELMLEAIKKTKRSNRVRSGRFNELLLKLPTLQAGFKEVKAVFDAVDDNKDGLIDVTEFRNNCHLLGLNPTDDLLLDIFKSADLDNSKRIDMHEFVSILTVVYLLKPDQVAEKLHVNIRVALGLIEGFFCHFDSSADGYLEKQEVLLALGGKDNESSRAATKLFSYLDWDNSGHISFKEFVVGIKKFALEDEEDEAAGA